MASLHIESVLEHLWRPVEEEKPPQLYALLDAARSDAIYPKIMSSGLESACLYRGDKAQELALVAPYLVGLQRENPFTRWLLENGWGKSWGIIVESTATFNELKRHFRSFLMVYDEEGNSLYFRYYDPRVFRVYLPTCNAAELETVFGPVGSYMMEDEDPLVFLRFSSNNGKCRIEKVRLGQPH